ncbi:MAG: sulfite exporter TauE/SafE family protein [candidate division Zixibacteria bacterium]|nr:sulfite exporter TauE/SafE family protein [candidate division Zixibacteria bacterium]
MLHFPISGVETYWWLPVAVAFLISTLTSMGGLSGAFILLPFQVSFLGFSGPGVTPTNLLYNVISTPSGVWRFHHERRMVWSLSWTIIIGTLPGVFLGAIIRTTLLPDPELFKLFVGIVLLFLGIRMSYDLYKTMSRPSAPKSEGIAFHVVNKQFNLTSIEYEFNGRSYSVKTWKIIGVSFVVGIIGGTYGIGGAAIIVPFLVGVFGLPIHTVAGAALLGNFMTSIAGVLFYLYLDAVNDNATEPIRPDWLLGILLGIGGAMGTYVGARLQRYVSALAITGLVIVALLGIAVSYIIGFLS